MINFSTAQQKKQFIFSYGVSTLHEWPTSFKPIIEQPEHLLTAANLKKGKPAEKKKKKKTASWLWKITITLH